MMVVVSYDVSVVSREGRRRLRRISKTCEDYGSRVQNSVFQCFVGAEQWVVLRQKLLREFEPSEDSLRFYFLGNNWKTRIEHHGTKADLSPEEPLVL